MLTVHSWVFTFCFTPSGFLLFHLFLFLMVIEQTCSNVSEWQSPTHQVCNNNFLYFFPLFLASIAAMLWFFHNIPVNIPSLLSLYSCGTFFHVSSESNQLLLVPLVNLTRQHRSFPKCNLKETCPLCVTPRCHVFADCTWTLVPWSVQYLYVDRKQEAQCCNIQPPDDKSMLLRISNKSKNLLPAFIPPNLRYDVVSCQTSQAPSFYDRNVHLLETTQARHS